MEILKTLGAAGAAGLVAGILLVAVLRPTTGAGVAVILVFATAAVVALAGVVRWLSGSSRKADAPARTKRSRPRAAGRGDPPDPA